MPGMLTFPLVSPTSPEMKSVLTSITGTRIRWDYPWHDHMSVLWKRRGFWFIPSIPMRRQGTTSTGLVLRCSGVDFPSSSGILRRCHCDQVLRCLHQVPCSGPCACSERVLMLRP